MKTLLSLSVKRAIWILLAIPLLTVSAVSAAEAKDKSEKSEKSKDPGAANNIELGATVAKKGEPASVSKQTAIEAAVNGFPTVCAIEPVGSNATVLTGDDQSLDASGLLPAFESFAFFGKRFGPGRPAGGIFVGTNGNITFGRAVTDFSESLEELATYPMLAAFWQDLVADADHPVTIEFKPDPNRLVATWNQVREFGTANTRNTFQITLFLDIGAYQIVYDGIETTSSVVGVSQGFVLAESDLSAQPATQGRQFHFGYLAERFGGGVDAFDLDHRCVIGAPLPATDTVPVFLVQ